MNSINPVSTSQRLYMTFDDVPVSEEIENRNNEDPILTEMVILIDDDATPEQLQAKWNENPKFLETHRIFEGYMYGALYCSITNHNSQLVSFISEKFKSHSVSINKLFYDGSTTPLRYALDELLRVEFEARGNRNNRDSKKFREEIIPSLLKAGADVNLAVNNKSKWGKDYSIFTCALNDIDLTKLFMRYGGIKLVNLMDGRLIEQTLTSEKEAMYQRAETELKIEGIINAFPFFLGFYDENSQMRELGIPKEVGFLICSHVDIRRMDTPLHQRINEVKKQLVSQPAQNG